MDMGPFSPTLGLLGIGVLVFSVCLYRLLLPKPIPGIPYNKHAARNILGDLPQLAKYMKETKEINAWLINQCRIHDSPIVQVFPRPFSKPVSKPLRTSNLFHRLTNPKQWVIISDYREAQDIVSRRGREFDRAAPNKAGLSSISPHFQICLDTNDEWRSNRKLMNETMSTTFLHNVIAPIIHSTTLDIMDLWRQKCRLAEGRPFSAHNDIYKGALDIIFQTAFGVKVGATRSQVDFLSKLSEIPLDQNPEVAATIPATKDPEILTAMLTLTDTVEYVRSKDPLSFKEAERRTDDLQPIKFPFPTFVHKVVLNTFPSAIKALKLKEKLITDELSSAFKKFSESTSSKQDAKSAVELMVMREVQAAKKEGREARPDTPQLRDELYGFILGGKSTCELRDTSY